MDDRYLILTAEDDMKLKTSFFLFDMTTNSLLDEFVFEKVIKFGFAF